MSLLIRKTKEYLDWKAQIFVRDDRKCTICDSTKSIEADHIVPFSTLLKDNDIKSVEDAIACEELWDVDNGRTLCHECHRKTDTYGNKKKTR